jgi:hypothetical protein
MKMAKFATAKSIKNIMKDEKKPNRTFKFMSHIKTT